ncbi:carboxymuconolactone decarboxylase family protein [Glacieibacterium sp.]|uniref:(R)-mandelonitrile lyase n=1 Tax=Glacieibacterium sp. TaxID=2860237 RepID=UPI003AFFE6F0
MNHAKTAAIALALTTPVEAQERVSIAPKNMQAIASGLADYTDNVLFGDVWLRPELAPRDRSMVTLSVLIATGKTAQLPGHLGRGLTNGIKPAEIAGIVTHLAFYTGWPNAVSSLNEIEKVFADRKIDLVTLAPLAGPPAVLPADAERAAMVQKNIAPVAPKFAALTNEVIFGDLWRRTDLSPRDRSLVTIAALAAGGDAAQLEFHIRYGLENGLTKTEIGEVFTHLAFYAGWPKASAAVAVAGRVFASEAAPAKPAAAVQRIQPGQAPTALPASYFTGSARMTSLFKGTGEARLGRATVSFQPGAHTNWHTHPLGQLLIVTEGRGWVQAEGEAVREMTPGDVIWIAPGVRHWHGATRSSPVTHVAVAEAADGVSVDWLEAVSDSHYQGPA